MPYKSVSELPSSLKKLPHKAQVLYMNTFNTSYKGNHDDTLASRVAWTIVKKQFKQIDGKWVAKGLSQDYFTFNLDMNDVFVQKAADGNYYMEGVLADILPDTSGWSFTEETLQDYADQINKGQIIGGITHSEWDELKLKYSHLSESEFIAKALTERKGILKTIKAIYEKGKLWIKAIIDKRYINHAKKFNKMSIEAYVPKALQQSGKYLGGRVLGFALDNNPVNVRASVTRIE